MTPPVSDRPLTLEDLCAMPDDGVLVWVVDPEREAVTAYRSLLSPRVLSRKDELDGEEVVPGFRVAIVALFET